MDGSGESAPVSYNSYRSKRVARVLLSAEANAFADLFDNAYAFRSQLECAFLRAVPMHLLTGSKSLLSVISKGSWTREKRVMPDIYAARQAYKVHEISNIGFVRLSNNVANGLTKSKMQAALHKSITNGKHRIQEQQWIIRDPETRKYANTESRLADSSLIGDDFRMRSHTQLDNWGYRNCVECLFLRLQS